MATQEVQAATQEVQAVTQDVQTFDDNQIINFFEKNVKNCFKKIKKILNMK